MWGGKTTQVTAAALKETGGYVSGEVHVGFKHLWVGFCSFQGNLKAKKMLLAQSR